MHSREPMSFILPLCRTPQMLPRILKGMYTKHIRAPREYRRGDGRSHIPIQLVGIKITNACNLRCRTCAQWGETGYNFGRSAKDLAKVVPVETYMALVDQLAAHRPFYYIWGGEPFLYPDLFKLTAAIKQSRSLLALVTNATFLEANAKAVVDQGWDALMFSLDGPESLHDEIRGRKGTFKKVKAGIDAVQRRRAETGRSVPWLMPLITVSTWNAATLDQIVGVASELGADCAVIYYSWFTNEAVGEAHTRILENRLGITPNAWRGYLFNHQVDTGALKESLNRIRAQQFPFPILYVPDLRDDQLDRYYRNPADFMGYGPCISPWTTVEIMPNGDVATCRDYPDYVTGSILDASMEEIWNGERYVAFRKALSENGGTFPICARCCGLMGW